MSKSRINFSNALQKYYTRKGNRILFSNGMTLNQLAWEMWERLGYREIDPSVLSRVLAGKRLFTPHQLEIFASLLKLTRIQFIQLDAARGADMESRFGLSTNNSSFLEDKLFVELIKHNIEKITEFDFIGRFYQVEDWINTLKELIEAKVWRTFSKDELIKILCLKAQLLIKQNHFLMTVKYKGRTQREILENGEEIMKLAGEIKKTNLLSNANMNVGDIFFILRRYRESIPYFSNSIPYFDKESSDLAAGWSPIRSLALSYAYINKKGDFESIKKLILSRVEDLDPGFQVINYDALARAEGILQNYGNAEHFSDKCHEIYKRVKRNNGKYKEVIPIFLIRTELEIEKDRNVHNKNYLEKRGKLGLELASRYRYKRYWIKIRSLLADILN